MPRHIKALIVVPENNTTMQPEISALCPTLAPITVARVKRPARTLLLEDLPAYAEATLDAIEPFTAEPWDLVIHGCTAAGFLAGPNCNARMIECLRAHPRHRCQHRRRDDRCIAQRRRGGDRGGDALSAAGQ
jgi:maleate cis-trans isomerase